MSRNVVSEIFAITEFLGDEITEEQVSRLMDYVRQLSVSDREFLLGTVYGPLYTELSMHNAEMRGLHNA